MRFINTLKRNLGFCLLQVPCFIWFCFLMNYYIEYKGLLYLTGLIFSPVLILICVGILFWFKTPKKLLQNKIFNYLFYGILPITIIVLLYWIGGLLLLLISFLANLWYFNVF